MKSGEPNEVKDEFLELDQSQWSMWLKKPIETKEALVAISSGIDPFFLNDVLE